ncbi:hypothetical protein KEM56_004498 [Ascosphaera pollenicola]|nr:hypothetical protein KEM56_004498 [Ascosphaera pollenicola]
MSSDDHRTCCPSYDGQQSDPKLNTDQSTKPLPIPRRTLLSQESISSEGEERAYYVHKSGMQQPGPAMALPQSFAHIGLKNWQEDTPIYRPTLERECKRQKLYTFVEGSLTCFDSPHHARQPHTKVYTQQPFSENQSGGKVQQVKQIQHTSSWRDLLPGQATDIARLEAAFKEVLESTLDEYLRANIPSNLDPHLCLGTYTIPIYLGTIVVAMLNELARTPANSSWSISLGDIRNTLVKFICLHDCFSAMPPQEKPHLLVTTVRLVIAHSPFASAFDRCSSLRILPVPTPDYIRLEGQVPSPVNEGRQIILIPHYVSPIFGSVGAGTFNEREISFVSHTTWFKWNDLLRSFVGIVPFTLFEDKGHNNDGDETVYTSLIDVEGVCVTKLEGGVCFEKKIACQLVLHIKPRALTKDKGVMDSVENNTVDCRSESEEYDSSSEYSMAETDNCSSSLNNGQLRPARNATTHDVPGELTAMTLNHLLADHKEPIVQSCAMPSGLDPNDMLTQKHVDNVRMYMAAISGSDESQPQDLKHDIPLQACSKSLGPSVTGDAKLSPIENEACGRYDTRRSPNYHIGVRSVDCEDSMIKINRNSRRCLLHAFSSEESSNLHKSQDCEHCMATFCQSPHDPSGYFFAQGSFLLQTSFVGSKPHNIPPTKTIRNQDGKIWTIDDSYLIKEQDKPRFLDMLRGMSQHHASSSHIAASQSDSHESLPSMSIHNWDSNDEITNDDTGV